MHAFYKKAAINGPGKLFLNLFREQLDTSANNLITVLLITSDWTALQTHSILKDISEPSAGYDILLPLVVVYPVLLLIFSKKYKWTGWNEKLTGKIVLQPN